MHFSCIYKPFRPEIEAVIVSSFFNIYVYGEKQLLIVTLVLKNVDRGDGNF